MGTTALPARAATHGVGQPEVMVLDYCRAWDSIRRDASGIMERQPDPWHGEGCFCRQNPEADPSSLAWLAPAILCPRMGLPRPGD